MKSDELKATATAQSSMKKLRFHNYLPRTEELKKYCEEQDEPNTTLQRIIESQNEMLRSASRKFGDPALDLDHMVPKKGDWDMKRSLSGKFERLEQRTRRAVIDIVRQRQRQNGKLGRVDDDQHSVSSDELQ